MLGAGRTSLVKGLVKTQWLVFTEYTEKLNPEYSKLDTEYPSLFFTTPSLFPLYYLLLKLESYLDLSLVFYEIPTCGYVTLRSGRRMGKIRDDCVIPHMKHN